MIETAPKRCVAVEIKSGGTIGGDFFNGLDFWRANLTGIKLQPWLIYGGDAKQTREKGAVVPWSDLSPLLRAVAA